MAGKIIIRDAKTTDLEIIAGIFTRARRTLAFLPMLHTEAEDRLFVRDNLLASCRIRLAFYEKRACGFVARHDDWIPQLHVDPVHFGLGVGSALVRDAQKGAARLQLWCFQKNLRARRLYEHHGFVAAELTDGNGNEEKAPDVRYVWERAPAATRR